MIPTDDGSEMASNEHSSRKGDKEYGSKHWEGDGVHGLQSYFV